MPSLSFNVHISNTHCEDILAFLLFCKKRGIACDEHDTNTLNVNFIMHWGILNNELTAAQFVELCGNRCVQQERFEAILDLQQGAIDVCESELECFESDHPRYAELAIAYREAHENMERIRRFIGAVTDLADEY